MNNAVLYVFVRTDLPSMTPGKAQAHSGHAANAFIYKNYIKANPQSVRLEIYNWIESTPQGFGTQINLKAPWSEVIDIIAAASQDGFLCDLVTDPTYPYEVDEEVFDLLPNETHTAAPIVKDNKRYMCFRVEQTAAYIFGSKEDLAPYISQYPLHP
jgi:hypothetical protein